MDLTGALDAAADELSTLIGAAQTLLSDVEALAGVVDAGDALSTVGGLAQTLISTLTGLANQVSV